ncbi:MAG: NmrA family NAD(P)-binding protein [Candidatus Acidiferrales bacterium]
MIAITGATGNTGMPAAEALLAKGEKVRAIGRDPKKLEPLVQKGAEASAGNAADAAFLTKAFEGANAVYLVLPADVMQPDMRAFQERLSDAYAAAILKARVPYAVTLSSIGAQHSEKTGPIVGLHNLEQKLNRIPGLNVLHLRPGFFMQNFFMSIQPLRTMGILPGGLPADVPMPMIAAKDIGTYAAGRLAAMDFVGSSAHELHGQRDITMKEAASILGKAIGKPDLKYMQVPFMMLEPALVQMGMPKSTAALMIEMWKAAIAGLVAAQAPRTAKNTTPTTLESFAAEVFAPAFLGKTASA